MPSSGEATVRLGSTPRAGIIYLTRSKVYKSSLDSRIYEIVDNA